ncbi:SusD/RagB family nutrient-binding outer membrane lipoprotein [Mucilaginibacter sp. PAMB04274]|uniref:SusD/RagB family nutrient-binding outer membrane lipoprotein n=1 Tax=Mucilaginibacter sp. PAMB04274 TaxID=3138568 RepID=UPI0031F6FEF1
MQRIYKYTSIALLALATATMPSCKKYFALDQDPNLVNDPTLQSLLTNTTFKMGNNSYNAGSTVAPYVQYLANPTASSATDTYQPVDYSGTWDAIYYALADATDMKNKAVAQNSSEFIGVADVALAYNLSLINDLWGSGPYSEAFKTNNFTPKYDSQQDVYNTCVTLINEAITQLSKTDATIKLNTTPTADLVHGGDRVKWLKTAYAIKARLLNKLSKRPNYDAAAVLAAVRSSYTTNADDAGMATFITRNPWAGVALSNANATLGGWLSEQLVDHLNGTTYGIFDPRIRKITDPTVTNTFIGTVNGAGNRAPGANTTKDENYISQKSPWTADTAPLLIATYAEMKFIEAEAALRSNDRTSAYAAYLAGINANMDKLQVPATDAERIAYMASPIVAVGAANLTLDLIFKEKYVATYLNPEAWNDARRYDYKYKDFTLPANAVLTTFIRRLAYPTSETRKNTANVPNVGALTDRIFWDQP